MVAANDGNDIVTTTGGDDNVDGGIGNDTISTGAGADTVQGGDGDDDITGGVGKDFLSGGLGVDTFRFISGDSGTTIGSLDLIQDWTSGADKLDLVGAGGTVTNYVETSAIDYANGLANANTAFGANPGLDYYVAQIGTDVVIFTDSGTNTTTDAIVLVGKTLADIAFTDIT